MTSNFFAPNTEAIMIKRLLVLFFVLFMTGNAVYAQTGSGTSSLDAILIPLNPCGTSTFSDQRNTAGFPNNYGNPSPEVWYTFTISGNANVDVNISLCGSNFDTYVRLMDWQGIQIASNDDACGLQSVLQSALSPGTYFILAEGYGSNYGNLVFSFSSTGNGSPSPGADMMSAIDAGTFSSTGSFSDTRNNSDPCLGNNMGQLSNDIYYKFKLLNTAEVELSHCGSSLDTYMHLLAEDGQEIAFNDDNFNSPCPGSQAYIKKTLSAGTYYMVSEGYNTNWGDIVSTINVNILSSAISADQNYIYTSLPRTPITNDNDLANAGANDVMREVQYFDGLGRSMQLVKVKANENATADIVQPFTYDAAGRQTAQFLSYVPSSGSSASYRSDALAAGSGIFNFYNPTGSGISGQQQSAKPVVTTSHPFSPSVFERSPINRVVEQGAPGNDWQPRGTLNSNGNAGHTVKTTYGTNEAGEVILWVTNNSGDGATGNGFYQPGTLEKIITVDENGNQKAQFTDSEGLVVCIKEQSAPTVFISTCFVYDLLGNLRYIIPPIPDAVNYPSSFVESDDVFLKYIYGYRRDTKGRIDEKKIPAKDWEFLVYNSYDQVVATQDGIQRKTGKWTFIKYDLLKRVIMTGEMTDNRSHQVITAAIASQPQNGEVADSNSPNGYSSNNSFPGSWNFLYTINYYDSYNFPGGSTFSSTDPTVSSQTSSLLTGKKIRKLDNGEMLLTEYYYDNKGRVVETVSQNHIGGSDRVLSAFNFTEQPISSRKEHSSSIIGNLNFLTEYKYDHMGRKLSVSETVNNGPKIMVSKIDYNGIGQMIAKHLHGNEAGSNFLQTIDYTYNERGWLKTSSAPLFAMQLNYNDAAGGVSANYNGNISNQYWGTPGNLSKHYDYTYDPLNRLKSGISNIGFSETGLNAQGIEYDNLGNIQKLSRTDAFTGTGNYVYNYNGNQLTSVNNLTNTYQYDENGNVMFDGRTNKQITYNYLNLPETESGGGQSMTYTYDAVGSKLKRVSTAGGVGTTIYDNDIVNDNGTTYILTEEGRVLNPTISPNYEYNLVDKLGNTRITFDTATGNARQVQVNDYFPFGMTHTGNTPASPANNYLYNHKELQVELGQYDYGARFYDPVIARWCVVDKLAEDPTQIDLSPYAYVANNPILKNDPDGNCPNCIIGGLIGGGVELAGQLISGKKFSEVDWVDVGAETLNGAVVGSGAGAVWVTLAKGTGVVLKATTDYSIKDGNQNVFNGKKSAGSAIFDAGADLLATVAGNKLSGALKQEMKAAIKTETKAAKALVKAENVFNKVTNGGRNMAGAKSIAATQKLAVAQATVKSARKAVVRTQIANTVTKTAAGEALKNGVQGSLFDKIKNFLGL